MNSLRNLLLSFCLFFGDVDFVEEEQPPQEAAEQKPKTKSIKKGDITYTLVTNIMNDAEASCLFGLEWKTRIFHGWCVGIEEKTNDESVKETYIRTYFKWHDKTWRPTLHWKSVNPGHGPAVSILCRPINIPPLSSIIETSMPPP